ATTEDKDWLALPEPSEYNEIEGLWNESVAACESAKVVEIAAEIMSMATEAEAGLIPGFGGSGVSSYYSAYANSSGIAHSEKGTVAFASLGAIARIESGVTPLIFSYDIRRSLDLDLDRAVEDVANTIRVCKRTEKGSSGEHTVVMHPSAYGQLIYYTLGQAVRGDNVARGKSKLADKIGETVAPEVVTIVDDGTAPLGTNTSIADDEGVPHQRTPIIKKGVLRSFLFDTYWANRTGEKSTGNARRNTRRGLVELAPTNTVVEPGRREIGEIIAGIEHGYLIRNVQGAHSSNPESGDFSVVGNPAILIQDGEMVGAIHGLMVAGNIYDLFKNAEEVAKTPLVQLGLIGPEIVFEDVNIITREG
ncbi:MAG: TldD/PmbA family protein, partial [Candidatus Bathyarchaeota archaeon]